MLTTWEPCTDATHAEYAQPASQLREILITEQAIGALVSAPGASNTVLDASVPYAASATRDLLGGLGHEPDSLCSEYTAGRLAKRAYGRAAELSTPGEPIIGLACTASLRTVRVPLLPGSHGSITSFCVESIDHSNGKTNWCTDLEARNSQFTVLDTLLGNCR